MLRFFVSGQFQSGHQGTIQNFTKILIDEDNLKCGIVDITLEGNYTRPTFLRLTMAEWENLKRSIDDIQV